MLEVDDSKLSALYSCLNLKCTLSLSTRCRGSSRFSYFLYKCSVISCRVPRASGSFPRRPAAYGLHVTNDGLSNICSSVKSFMSVSAALPVVAAALHQVEHQTS
ncbi:hypothetical protein INR49_007305 [Caranx melampygus]|nr:hypothetical protein INR49_007305 [Caranx melampygus]